MNEKTSNESGVRALTELERNDRDVAIAENPTARVWTSSSICTENAIVVEPHPELIGIPVGSKRSRSPSSEDQHPSAAICVAPTTIVPRLTWSLRLPVSIAKLDWILMAIQRHCRSVGWEMRAVTLVKYPSLLRSVEVTRAPLLFSSVDHGAESSSASSSSSSSSFATATIESPIETTRTWDEQCAVQQWETARSAFPSTNIESRQFRLKPMSISIIGQMDVESCGSQLDLECRWIPPPLFESLKQYGHHLTHTLTQCRAWVQRWTATSATPPSSLSNGWIDDEAFLSSLLLYC